MKSDLGPGDDARRAIEAAIKLLAASAKTEVMVRERLAARGFSEGSINAAIDYLRSRRLLDDGAVIEGVIARAIGDVCAGSARAARARAWGRAMAALARRGVDEEQAAAAVQRALGPMPEEGAVHEGECGAGEDDLLAFGR